MPKRAGLNSRQAKIVVREQTMCIDANCYTCAAVADQAVVVAAVPAPSPLRHLAASAPGGVLADEAQLRQAASLQVCALWQ
jgi:hypothetical protein